MLTPDERYVQALFRDRFDLDLRKVVEGKTRKSPDFEAWRSVDRLFACEVKSITTPAPGDMAALRDRGWLVDERDDGLWTATASPNTVGKVGSLIHDAHGQLQSRPRPWSILFLNDEPLVDIMDLDEALTGYLPGPPLVIGDSVIRLRSKGAAAVAFGRLAAEKYDIDLYLWVNRHAGDQVFARYPTQAGHDLAVGLLGSR